jgi:phosphoribosylaminoimidazolecarboxamide formyltransferase/IMP cyclohydrolase
MVYKDIRRMYRTAVQEEFPGDLKIVSQQETLSLKKRDLKLRYGTNPNQRAAIFTLKGTIWERIKELKVGKGGLSQTNICDVDRALRILRYFSKPSCALMKHLVPSGFASSREKDNLKTVFIRARDCDPVAAFGGVVVFNSKIDKVTAEEVTTGFVEVVCAPDYDNSALKKFDEKKDLRVLQFDQGTLMKEPVLLGDKVHFKDLEFTSLIGGGVILADPFLTKFPKDVFQTVTVKKPSTSEVESMIFSWHILIGVRSNGIVVSKDYRTLGIGSGQQDRVTAVKLAIEKARSRGHKDELNGAVLASDGFFPFRDSVDEVAKHGVSAIIQPGGSIRDEEVIEACNEHGIPMVFTGERVFSHF